MSIDCIPPDADAGRIGWTHGADCACFIGCGCDVEPLTKVADARLEAAGFLPPESEGAVRTPGAWWLTGWMLDDLRNAESVVERRRRGMPLTVGYNPAIG